MPTDTASLVQETQSWLDWLDRHGVEELAYEQVEALRALLRRHEYRYYVLAEPAIADPEYDRLFKALEAAEAAHPEWKTSDSPTQRVGSDLSEAFPEVAHLTPMLSLDNSYNEEDLLDFDRRVKELSGRDDLRYTVEPKFDGAGISLIYENDRLRLGISRGDGRVGEDITPNVRTIRSLPLRAELEGMGLRKVELRGEILMSKQTFQKINQQRIEAGQTPFANPRNATSGALRLLDPREVARRQLTAFVYHLAYAEDNEGRAAIGERLTSNYETLQALHQAGFYTPVDSLRRFDNIRDAMRYCETFEARRDDYDYEVDGMVVKVDDFQLREEIGYTSHHPRWAMAYKFQARQARSVLERVEFQVGRIGTVTPVAKIRPVEVAGVQVTSVSLFNEDFLREKDLRYGDTVVVERAGDVIPYIVRVDPNQRQGDEAPIRFPAQCPACGSALERPEDEAAWRCININCPAQVVERLKHFVSKDAMDIGGMGEKVIQRFYREGLLIQLTDLYHLDYDRIESLEGFGRKSVDNLRQAVEASKHRSLDRILFALGIRFVGLTTARLLAAEVDDLREFYSWTEEDFVQLPDIGPRMAHSLYSFFRQPDNRALLEALASSGVAIRRQTERAETKAASSGPLAGKTFLFTGSLARHTRGQAQQAVEALGAQVVGNVSKKLDYLVVGEAPGSKLKKAERLGTVEILDEAAFEALLEGVNENPA